MKKISLILMLLVLYSSISFAGFRFGKQERKNFWRGDKLCPIMYTFCSLGCIYAGTQLLSTRENATVARDMVGGLMLSGGIMGVSLSVGFDYYFKRGTK